MELIPRILTVLNAVMMSDGLNVTAEDELLDVPIALVETCPLRLCEQLLVGTRLVH